MAQGENKIENTLLKGLQKCFEEIEAGELVVEYALKNDGGQVMAKIKCPFCQVFLTVCTNKKIDKTFRSFKYYNVRRHLKICQDLEDSGEEEVKEKQ